MGKTSPFIDESEKSMRAHHDQIGRQGLRFIQDRSDGAAFARVNLEMNARGIDCRGKRDGSSD